MSDGATTKTHLYENWVIEIVSRIGWNDAEQPTDIWPVLPQQTLSQTPQMLGDVGVAVAFLVVTMYGCIAGLLHLPDLVIGILEHICGLLQPLLRYVAALQFGQFAAPSQFSARTIDDLPSYP